MTAELQKSRRRPRSMGWQARIITLIIRWWAIFFKKRLHLDITVHNKQAFPQGPIIVVGNHTSMADPFIWGAIIPRNGAVMAKHDLWWNPVTAPIMLLRGDIPVKRKSDQGRARAWNKGMNILLHGGVLGLYPSAGISLIGRDLPWRKGFAEMALHPDLAEQRVTIIAIKMDGVADLVPPKPDRKARGGKRLNRGAKVTAIFSDPIMYDTYKSMSPTELTLYVRDLHDALELPEAA
jgi:1-acyl-sn-glycerol-3-phosphate acyltransferase